MTNKKDVETNEGIVYKINDTVKRSRWWAYSYELTIFGYKVSESGAVRRGPKELIPIYIREGIGKFVKLIDTNGNEQEFLLSKMIYETFNSRKLRGTIVYKDGDCMNVAIDNLIDDKYVAKNTKELKIVKEEPLVLPTVTATITDESKVIPKEPLLLPPVANSSIYSSPKQLKLKRTVTPKNKDKLRKWVPIRDCVILGNSTVNYLGKYLISNYGEVKRPPNFGTKPTDKLTKGNTPLKKGFKIYRLSKSSTGAPDSGTRDFRSDMLAAYHFNLDIINNPKLVVTEIEHLDGDKLNSYVDNLKFIAQDTLLT